MDISSTEAEPFRLRSQPGLTRCANPLAEVLGDLKKEGIPVRVEFAQAGLSLPNDAVQAGGLSICAGGWGAKILPAFTVYVPRGGDVTLEDVPVLTDTIRRLAGKPPGWFITD